MARLRVEMDTSRLTRMTSNARTLAEAGHLRDDLTVEHAGEVLWTYSSPELYELLVLGRGWPAERYGTFIADAMIAALLHPTTATPSRPPTMHRRPAMPLSTRSRRQKPAPQRQAASAKRDPRRRQPQG